MFGCTCAPLPHLVSSELLYVTSTSFFKVTMQRTECAVIAAARSQRPALFRDVRTAVSAHDALTVMLRRADNELVLLSSPCSGGVGKECKRVQVGKSQPRSSECARGNTPLCGLPWLACSVGANGNDRMSRVGQFFFLQHRRHIAASEWCYAVGHRDRSTVNARSSGLGVCETM